MLPIVDTTDHEKIVLACILKKPELLKESSLKETDFLAPKNQKIFKAVIEIQKAGLVPDLTTIAERCKDELDRLIEIDDLQGYAPANFSFYVGKITGRAETRQIRDSIESAYEALNSPEPDLPQILNNLQKTIKSQNLKSTQTKSVGRLAGLQLNPISEMPITAPDYIINDMIEADTLTGIVGKPGSGKSFLALSIALHVASGNPLNGHEVSKQGPVIIFIGEGQSGVMRRITAWTISHDVILKDLPVFISSIPAALTDPENVESVAGEIARIAESVGDPRLIIFDTLQRNFGGGDENSTQDMTKVVRALDFIRSLYHSTILVVHHAGHSAARGRGSSVWNASNDSEFFMEKDDSGLVIVTHTKSKDAPPLDPITYELNTVYLGVYDNDNKELSSAVLVETDRVPEPKQNRGKWQKLGLEVLIKLIQESEGIHVKVDTWKTACMVAAMPRQRFSEIKKTLSELGEIQIVSGFVSMLLESCPVCPDVYINRTADKSENIESLGSGQKPDAIRTPDRSTDIQGNFELIEPEDEPVFNSGLEIF